MRIFWKIYAILFSLIVLFGLGILIINQRLLPIREYFNIAITLISLIGLMAFAFRKTLFRVLFWKVWFIFYLLSEILFYIFVYHHLYEDKLLFMVSFVFSLPFYMALFLYAYRSNDIWLSQDKGVV